MRKRENLAIQGQTLQVLKFFCCRLSTGTLLFYCEIRNSALEGINCESRSDIWAQELILAINLKSRDKRWLSNLQYYVSSVGQLEQKLSNEHIFPIIKPIRAN